MDLISFRCPSCNQGLKAPADKAGRKVRCTKCGTELTIPMSQAPASPPPPNPAPPTAAPFTAPAPKEQADPASYAFLLDPAEEAAKAKTEQPAEKKRAPKIKRRFRMLQEPEQWAKTRLGLGVVLLSVYFWAGAFGLQGLVLILGITQGPEYGGVAEKILVSEDPPEPEPGQPERVSLPGFLVGLISGYSLYAVAKVLLILASALTLAQGGIAFAGYSACQGIPDRYGTQGQVRALMILTITNMALNFIFKLLPLTGILNYALVPWFTPELCILDANTERAMPIHVFWSVSGFWEMLLTILVMSTYYAQPLLLSVLIWSIGLSLREPPVEEAGFGLIEITFGVAFTLLAYYLLSVTGTSPVLLILLRVGFGLWNLFTAILIVRFIMGIGKTRETIFLYVQAAEEEGVVKRLGLDDGEEEDEEEHENEQDEEGDEDEPPRRPSRRSRRFKEDDEDD
ncbi:MAG: hypothetical protein HY040_17240 [Planctomycetes bacterium]|nr:hypothetical protein [Planctomycetota bacterium]